ncbi:MAG: YggS family pyridoxal phosphate-dependent enzyme [Saprospiraceae bacterium]|nr:YggS family pyridoxal phosphate-dependent enzyme [Saprospiraceae bacterium]
MTNYELIQKKINEYNAQLIVVSKNRSAEEVLPIYNLGQRNFGENRPQELESKFNLLPKDINWHLIGHLQSNKVRSILPIATLIHSVDNIKLLHVLNEESKRIRKTQNILLQIKLSAEESKHGFLFTDLLTLLSYKEIQALANLNIIGVMGIGSLTSDPTITRNEFKTLKNYFSILKEKYFPKDDFKEISMGMSGDYQIALEEGATMVRVGSLLF